MPNRLAAETSPYLRQHKDNPVHWQPWDAQALKQAAAEEKPIFLSVGYSACHWCHVMEHESFENEQLAAFLNEHFVSIKVDREERPDVDQIYMNAVQMMTGRGGWPMSVFLTPAQKPFFAGTYWPPTSKMGMPGFDQVLAAVADAWQNRREQAIEQSNTIADRLAEHARAESTPQPPDQNLLHTAAAALERVFDHTFGGFGAAPKFPHSMDLQVLLRVWHRQRRDGVLEMVTKTLDRMAAGGIYDHLGGGFARYSVDDRWLVPHFEKMLYDNALLTLCYTEAFQVTGEPRYETVVRETLDYLLRDMRVEEAAFASAEDADSEGVEGKFYVWSAEEVADVLGDDPAEVFSYVFDVTAAGNFEGANILNLPKTVEQAAALLDRDVDPLRRLLDDARAKLFEHRAERVRPGRDDKVLVSWNGLAIEALARAAAAFGEPRYAIAAGEAAQFVLDRLRSDDGRLLHTYAEGQAKLDAYLDDYACFISALVALYEVDFQEQWITHAVELADQMIAHFRDPDGAGFFYTADDHERLIARVKDFVDSSVPSGNAAAATALARLGHLSARRDYLEIAHDTVAAFAGVAMRNPMACGQLLLATDYLLGPTPQIVLLGDAADDQVDRALTALRRRFLPNKVVALRATADANRDSPLAPHFADKTAQHDVLTTYVCRDFTCEAPIAGVDAAVQAWELLDRPSQGDQH